MTEWRTLTDSELVELVRKLRALDWSWRLADAEQVAAELGWQIERIRPVAVVLDTGLGPGSGRIRGRDGVATEIEARVTSYTTDDAAGRDRTRTAFAEMTAALSAEFGAPTTRVPGVNPRVRWAGPATTTVLRDSGVSVALHLVTNEVLAREDLIEELEQQGLP
ncbi:DUF6301 family protein [Nocardia flavorosea]|uniref:Uncharacterized protein n=1 Tax=Nocardia flavorosea TaxID=53429 RepID=A0A846YGU6_9NOCA|nr:DUF6301 family protein [Nocardia flavorosea]NKY56904.1 hypothetical protein [Nocardia flavorosea]